MVRFRYTIGASDNFPTCFCFNLRRAGRTLRVGRFGVLAAAPVAQDEEVKV